MKKLIICVFTILLLTSCESVDNSTQEDSTKIRELEEEIIALNEEILRLKYDIQIIKSNAQTSQELTHKTIIYNTFDVDKKYYNEANGYVELKLKLPQLEGDYDGIPVINKYFVDKEKFFYDELPLDFLRDINIEVKGEDDNYYRSAYYKLEAVLRNIISMSADLNGGAGGVGWAGIEGASFNLNTGKKLSLDDIFNVNKDDYMNFIFGFVSEEIMATINSNLNSGYGSGYNFNDAYSDEGQEDIRRFDSDNFYLTKDALVIFYPKYTLSCGAAGPQEFFISYEKILDVLAIDI